MYNFKKLISLAVALIMVMSVMPMAVSADNPVFTAPTERFFSNFSSATVPENVTSTKAATYSIVDDALRIQSTEGYDVRTTISGFGFGGAPVVIEYDMYGKGGSLKDNFYIFADDVRTKVYGSAQYNSIDTIRYALLDPSKGIVTLYGEDFLSLASVEGISQTKSTFSIGLWHSVNVSTAERVRYFDYDYIAAYDYTPMSIKLEDVTNSGATLKTTLPVDITNTTLTVSGSPVTLTKVEDTYNTYTAVFGSALKPQTAYTLSGSMAYLGGTEPYAASYEFTTPAKVYAAPVQHYFRDFEGMSVESAASILDGEFTSSHGSVSIADGELVLKRKTGDTNARVVINREIPLSSIPVVFEYHLSAPIGVKDNLYMTGSSGDVVIYSLDGTKSALTTSTRYMIYYPATGTASLYYPNTKFSKDIEGLPTGLTSTTFKFKNSSNQDARVFEYDYIAVYELADGMAIKLEDITVKGATLKTTMPVDVNNTALTVGGVPVTVTKTPNTYNTYSLAFGSTLNGLTDYTLSGSIPYLTGETPYTASYAFKTPEKTFEDAVPEEIYFEDFEGITEVPEGYGYSQAGILSVVDGKLRQSQNPDINWDEVTFDKWDSRASLSGLPAPDKKVIIEFYETANISGIENDFYIHSNNSGTSDNRRRIYTNDILRNAAKYVIYDPENNTATPYISDDFTVPATPVEFVEQTGDSFGIGLYAAISTADKYIEYDYFSVYELASEMMIKLEDVSTYGAVMKTTLPVDTAASQLMVGDVQVAIEKAPNAYNTYYLTFLKELSTEGEFTLSGNIKHISGETNVNYAFANPAKVLSFTSLTLDETDGVKAKAVATNSSQVRDWDVFLIVAAYDVNGKYIGAAMSKVTVVAGAENAILLSDAVVAEGAASYRPFLWSMQLTPYNINE